LIELALRISAADLLGKKLQVTKYFQATMHRCQADAARLQEVFWNIIRNAVKFTPEHGQIAITTRNDERQQIVIEFTDSGMGIEPELQPRIFDAFAQGEGAMTARMRGLGLGLAISKRIVDLHGGTIQVRSAGRGQGSTFIITLSAVAELSARPAEPSTEISVEPAPALEILIVEDHEDTAHVLCRILETTGYQVVLARTLLEARTLAATRRFQLVISDLGLPDGSGLDLMRELRAQQDIDGIAISGYGTAEDRRASEAAGFSEHLTKPVDVERLQAAIRDSLSRIKTAPVVMPERSAARF
jgi:CheY-like chemotaxis protein/anti-sigma regulatory factor (Ser/Thr protein kinase)